MDRDDFDVGPLAPSGQMALFGDLAKTGDCATQLQVRDLTGEYAAFEPDLLVFMKARKITGWSLCYAAKS